MGHPRSSTLGGKHLSSHHVEIATSTAEPRLEPSGKSRQR